MPGPAYSWWAFAWSAFALAHAAIWTTAYVIFLYWTGKAGRIMTDDAWGADPGWLMGVGITAGCLVAGAFGVHLTSVVALTNADRPVSNKSATPTVGEEPSTFASWLHTARTAFAPLLLVGGAGTAMGSVAYMDTHCGQYYLCYEKGAAHDTVLWLSIIGFGLSLLFAVVSLYLWRRRSAERSESD